MLKRTEVLAAMAATIAAGLLQRKLGDDEEGDPVPYYDVDDCADLVQHATSIARDILDGIENDDAAGGKAPT